VQVTDVSPVYVLAFVRLTVPEVTRSPPGPETTPERIVAPLPGSTVRSALRVTFGVTVTPGTGARVPP
jgi:hypothetical protein